MGVCRRFPRNMLRRMAPQGPGTSPPPDAVPDAFSFTPKDAVELSTSYDSDPVTLTGMNAAAAFAFEGGTLVVNGVDMGSAGTVPPNPTIKARMLSSAAYSDPITGTATVGGVSADFVLTTKDDPTPAPTPTPTPAPSGITLPKEGPADYTVSFAGLTTQTQRQNAIKAKLDQAYTDMAGATDAPKKIEIPAGDCGALFIPSHVYPSLLSVVPADYGNPPVFTRFGHSGTGLTNVVIDGMKIYDPATGSFTRMLELTQAKDVTISNWQITSYDPTIPNGSEDILSYAPTADYVQIAEGSCELRANGFLAVQYSLVGAAPAAGADADGYIEISLDGGGSWIDTRLWASGNRGNFTNGPQTPASGVPIRAFGFASQTIAGLGVAAGTTILARLFIRQTGAGVITSLDGVFRVACVSGVMGLPVTITNCENLTLYRVEAVGGSTSQCYLAQRSSSSNLNPCLNPRIIECCFRGGNEDGIRPWGAQNFLIQDTFMGLGSKAIWFHGQHADGVQIAQLAGAGAFPSSGTIDGCMVAQVDKESEVEGLMQTDWNVPYSGPISYTDNTIIGCGLNSIKAAHITGKTTVTGNRVFGLRYANADTARIVLDTLSDVDFLDNKSEQLVQTGVTFTTGGTSEHSTTGMGLATKADALAKIADWKAAHPGVPFNLPDIAVPGFTLM